MWVHQLDLMTDLLGTPSLDTISRVRNEKARRYLSSMRKKQPIPFSQKFPNADPLALKLLERLLAFDPNDRPTATEALAHPYFKGLAKVEREPSCQPITKMEFEFERRNVTKEDIRELIFLEILEYHPQLLKEYISGAERASFLYPSAVDQFKKQFARLEENGDKSVLADRKHASLPRSTVHPKVLPQDRQQSITGDAIRSSQPIPQRAPIAAKPVRAAGPVMPYENTGLKDSYYSTRVVRDTATIAMPQLLHPAAPPPSFYFHRSSSMSGKIESSSEQNKDHVAINMRATASATSKLDQRIANEISMLQSNSNPPPFSNGIAVATAAANPHYRKVGPVQFGMTGMY